MAKNIVVLPGDGIGPEVTAQAVLVLKRVAELFGHEFAFTYADIGGASLDKYNVPLTPEALAVCKGADALLLGAVGGPKWDEKRPETALLSLRKELGLFANLRPAFLFPCLEATSPLKKAEGIDLLIVRELTGGLYFGKKQTVRTEDETYAVDTMRYSEEEIERIGRIAFNAALGRRGKLTSVDKANVLECSRLWREVMHRLAEEYPDVEYSDMLVDNAAMQLIRDPSQFDVIVTENMFGDILSDEAAALVGSIGMMPSASLGVRERVGLYEPIHGSAPDIAGRDMANPIGMILSAAMLLRYSFGLEHGAQAIENAVYKVLNMDYRTADIAGGGDFIGCREMGRLILQLI